MKELWILLGIITLILGVLGIILPVLPTTPFILVTAYSFTKGSDKLSNWLKSNKFLSKYLGNMVMTRRKKIILNIIVDGILIFYIITFSNLYVRIGLILIIFIKHFIFHKYVKTT